MLGLRVLHPSKISTVFVPVQRCPVAQLPAGAFVGTAVGLTVGLAVGFDVGTGVDSPTSLAPELKSAI